MDEFRRGRPPRTAPSDGPPFAPALASTPALADLWHGTCPGRVRGARPGSGRGAAVQGCRRWNAVLPLTVPVPRGRFAGFAEAAATAGLTGEEACSGFEFGSRFDDMSRGARGFCVNGQGKGRGKVNVTLDTEPEGPPVFGQFEQTD